MIMHHLSKSMEKSMATVVIVFGISYFLYICSVPFIAKGLNLS